MQVARNLKGVQFRRGCLGKRRIGIVAHNILKQSLRPRGIAQLALQPGLAKTQARIFRRLLGHKGIVTRKPFQGFRHTIAHFADIHE